jgi:hypothetical protein
MTEDTFLEKSRVSCRSLPPRYEEWLGYLGCGPG